MLSIIVMPIFLGRKLRPQCLSKGLLGLEGKGCLGEGRGWTDGKGISWL